MKKIAILFAVTMFVLVGASTTFAQIDVGVSVQVAPPELPYYAQPMCPGDGYMWMPGYWAYGNDGYYWVPGAWVYPPNPGYLWTPCYWSYSGGYYGWHGGYWGEHVGFYGGVNYGYGYSGVGFGGGRWEGGRFRYNAAVVNINTTVIHNSYNDRTVIHATTNRTSFNGPGGISARPTSGELIAVRERHLAPTAEQSSHQVNASKDRNQFVSVNHGHPATVAVKSTGTRANPESHPVKTSPVVHPVADKPRNPATRVVSQKPTEAPRVARQARVETPVAVEHPRANPVEERVSVPRQQRANPSPQHANAPREQRANPPQQRANPMPSQPAGERKNK